MRFLILPALLILIEIYAFKGLRVMSVGMDPFWRRIISIAFWLTTALAYGSVIYMMSKRSQMSDFMPYTLFNFVIGFFLICLIGKLLFGTFHLLDDVVHFFRWCISKLSQKPVSEAHEKMTRVQFFNQVGLVATTALVGSMIYGVTKGKFGYRTLSETLKFPNLPEGFHGMRIVHISDLHIGSFDNQFDEVQKGFDMINALQPDYIFFTGDLVNNFSEEAEPWIDRLSGLTAKYGKFSILGNHDYGDYTMSDFPEKKKKHFDRLVEIHGEAGFRLLRNENVYLENNGSKIALLGTENWGLGFHQYGDLAKTMNGIPEDDFKIMLSHDPTFWEEQVRNKTNVAITLSGHTHGAQFGVELPQFGIKFSPVSLRYKRWGGLYEENGQYLYVNRGFGYLAFPGRVGMPPEITLIELQKA
jgi:uncharacterized protein